MSLNEAVVIDIVDHRASCSSYILSCRVFAAAALPFVSKASLTDFCNVDDDSVGEITKELARKYLSIPLLWIGNW